MAAYGFTLMIKVCSNRGIDKVLMASYGPNLRLLIPLAKKKILKSQITTLMSLLWNLKGFFYMSFAIIMLFKVI